MTRVELERFIAQEVKGLWPQWEATDAELRVWMSSLAPFDYGLARAAAQACFREQSVNYHRPVLGKFLEHARALSRKAGGPSPERPDPTTDVFIECYEPPPDRAHVAGVRKAVYVTPASKQGDPEHAWACALSMAARFDQLYGGHWIAVRTTPVPDDGLRGEPARQRAYELILAGPDTPGRRFLRDLLAPRTWPPVGQSAMRAPHGAPDGEPTRIGRLCETQALMSA
jgi:hypothetical protein